MLCDAVQGLGRVEIPEGPTWSRSRRTRSTAPRAIGALWMRKGAEPAPLIHGGGQERGMRSGTLSPALCVGFGAAAKLASERRTRRSRPCRAAVGSAAVARARAGLDGQRQHGPALPRQSQHPPRGPRCGAADCRPARHRFLARLGLRQRVGAAEPCAPRARAVGSRGALVDPPRLRPLHERGGAGRRAARRSTPRRGPSRTSPRDPGAVSSRPTERSTRKSRRSPASGCSTSPGPRASRSRARARA